MVRAQLRVLAFSVFSLCSWSGVVLGTREARADSLDYGTPIIIQDELGLQRDSELVSMSFPCAETAGIMLPGSLRILDENAKEVPVQWRVLTRWRGRPDDTTKPIRFALAQFRVTLLAGQKLQYMVDRRVPSDPPPPVVNLPLKVSIQDGLLVVDTRVAEFSISTESATLFHSVRLDLDGDGVYGSQPAETIVAPGQSLGALLVDPYSGIYLGAGDPAATVTVEEQGPLAAVVRVDAAHLPLGLGTIGRDYLRFTTRYYFSARSESVRVEHSLRNDYLEDPLGAMAIGRYLLHTRVDPLGPVSVRYGGDPGDPVLGPFPLNLPLETALIQDSAGGAGWNQPGTTFQGWRLYATLPVGLAPQSYPTAPSVKAGSRAAGWMDVVTGGRGLFVSLRYPWQNYPYAFRTFFDGTVVLDLLPSEHQGTHWLDDAQRKTWDLTFTPHDGNFDPKLQSQTHQKPVRPRPELAYLQETLAWGDMGAIRDPGLPQSAMIDRGNQELTVFYNTLDSKGGFGWQTFGEYPWAKSTHATGSPRNRLTWFDRFMTCGGNAWFERAEIFALHSMALRPYHIDGFQFAEHPNTKLPEGFPAWPGTDMLGRDQIPASLAPYKVGIPQGGSGWNGYDGEHMMVDDVYEYYLLTGSRDALDALRKVAEGMLTWTNTIDSNKPIPSSRFIGWVLRAQVKIWQATGDSRMLDLANKIVKIADKFRGKDPSTVTGLVYRWLVREIYGGGSHNMEGDYECPWQLGVGIYGLGLYYRETLDPTVIPIVKDISTYVVDYCVLNGVVVEAIDCDDHTIVNPKPKNDGVNMWLTSALAMGYFVTGSPAMRDLAEKIFDENATSFMTAGDNYHWYHTGAMILGIVP